MSLSIPDVNKIKPEVRGQSDFFSWKLYQWMKKKPYYSKVYRSTWCNIEGITDKPEALYIGSGVDSEGWFHGVQLKSLCRDGAKMQAWAFGPNFDTKNWIDCTDEFWANYMLVGVCAIHGDYSHKWVKDGDSRECEYCNKVEHKKFKMVKREYWE